VRRKKKRKKEQRAKKKKTIERKQGEIEKGKKKEREGT
jgi:hypothetical protein